MQLAAAQVIATLAARLVPLSLGTPLQTTREDGVTPDQLPAAWLWGGQENVERITLEHLHEHRLDITLRIVVAASAHIDDAMNTIGAEAMALLFAEPMPPFDLEHTGIDREAATRGGTRCGVITLTARATYQVYPGAPDVLV